MTDPYLSVVIPSYNEEARIGLTLDRVIAFLGRQAYSFEIIVVDDGSQDRTEAIARQKLSEVRGCVLKNPVRSGKGAVVKQGMLSAKGRFVLFSDADLSTPIEEISRFLKAFEEGYDIVIGSRALRESKLEVRQNVIRESMGKIFNCLARLFSFHSIRDSQCGFKCFRREVAQDLFSRQKLTGFSFDAEILYLAQRRGYRILEMPVTWRNSPHSRVNVLKDSLGMLLDLLRIRRIHSGERRILGLRD